MISSKNEVVKQRLVFFVAVIVGFFALMSFRLIDLQVVRGERYASLANDNRLFSMPIPAQRGVLLDRYGDPLVNNVRNYYSLTQSSELFSERMPIDREEALQKMATESSEAVGYDLSRLYKYPKSLAHILGYVGPVTAEELKESRQLKISDVVGKMGLEKNFDHLMQGEEGRDVYEIDALGNKQQIKQRQEPLPGIDIKTSLDPYLSEVALNALGDNQGSVVIADATTGEILSLISTPGFDANAFSKITNDESAEKTRKNMIKSFLSDQRQVFFNKSVGGSYPPGSVFKLVTALAGLESGGIDLNTTVLDEGILKVGEYEYANWYYTQYGRTEGEIGLIRSIARSNDIFFYKAAEFTGPNTIADTARMLGFGKPTNIEVQSETSGLVPDPAWKEKVIGERWYLGNTYHYGIGQGDILVSPVQVAQMVQAIGNNGKMCKPSLLSGSGGGNTGGSDNSGEYGSIINKSDCTELGFKQENIDIVLRGMLDACSPGGTGFPFFKHNEVKRGIVDQDEVSVDGGGGSDGEENVGSDSNQSIVGPNREILNGAMACKTGTAEFGGVDEQGYRNTHAWFAGVVGVDVEGLKRELGDGDYSGVGGENSETDGDLIEQDGNDNESSSSASLEDSLKKNIFEINQENNFGRSLWLEKVQDSGFPRKLVVVALVESDEDNLFKEGSRDAGPVVKDVIGWILGE